MTMVVEACDGMVIVVVINGGVVEVKGVIVVVFVVVLERTSRMPCTITLDRASATCGMIMGGDGGGDDACRWTVQMKLMLHRRE